MSFSGRVKFFKFLRALAFAHAILYTGLLISWAAGLQPEKLVLGWAHGITWIVMTTLMLIALRLRVVPWTLVVLVGVLGPLIPFVGAIGFLHFKPPQAQAAGMAP